MILLSTKNLEPFSVFVGKIKKKHVNVKDILFLFQKDHSFGL